MRNTDSGHEAGGADRSRPLANLDDVRSLVREKFNPFCRGDIPGDDVQIGIGVADQLDRLADALGVTVGRGDGDDVCSALD